MVGKIRIQDLLKAGNVVNALSQQVSWGRQKEQWLHGVLFGYLEAEFGHMESEYHPDGGRRRIDFRHGVSNPTLIELVVRRHGAEQSRRQNDAELRKLSRVPHSRAKSRFLLILDPHSKNPIREEVISASYRSQGPGRGRPPKGGWNPVRVIYVHPKKHYSFIWPKKSGY
jgi:hypothetical protein